MRHQGELTRRQREVLTYLKAFISEHGYAPSSRELSNACSLGGPSGAQRMLRALEDKGYIRRAPGVSRALTLVAASPMSFPLPPRGIELVVGAVQSQVAIGDATLRAAASLRSLDVKSELIADAAERYRLVSAIHTWCGPQFTDPHLDEPEFTSVFRALQNHATWPIFLIDYLIYNGTAAVVARHLVSGVPDLVHPLGEIASLCERATINAERWLENLVSDDRRNVPPNLRDRARAMSHACARSAAIVQRRWGSHKLGIVAPPPLPLVLTTG